MLPWPPEIANPSASESAQWSQPSSNLVLDFHGDPARAELCIFSDGNHHMALCEAVRSLYEEYPELVEVFYTTLPPPAIKQVLQNNSINIGNLTLTLSPHILIGPVGFIQPLVDSNFCSQPTPFVVNRGFALLIRKGNYCNISGVDDLLRDDVRLFLSNPETEGVSYTAYRDALYELLDDENKKIVLDEKLESSEMVYGQRIHHREAPESLASNSSDAAILYYHLALRFVRIFPEYFEIIDLTSLDVKQTNSELCIALVGDGGEWGRKAMSHLLSDNIISIYQYHGLLDARG